MLRNFGLSLLGSLAIILSAISFVSVAIGQQKPDLNVPPGTLLAGCQDVPEAVVLADTLQQRASRLERYTQDLDRRKRDIDLAQGQLTEKLVELRKLRQQLADKTGRTNQDKTASIDQLIALYDQMKPEQAGVVLSNLPPDFAAELLMRIRPDAGARILAAVDPSQAAILTSYMAASRVDRK